VPLFLSFRSEVFAVVVFLFGLMVRFSVLVGGVALLLGWLC